MVANETKTWAVVKDVDALWVRQQVEAMVRRLGASERVVWQVAIAVGELVTNILKFAGAGTLTVVCASEDQGGRLQVVAEDSGPGIADAELALRDGYSEGHMMTPEVEPRARRGLGAGLGAVRRMMDSLEIVNKAEGGVRVTAGKRFGNGR